MGIGPRESEEMGRAQGTGDREARPGAPIIAHAKTPPHASRSIKMTTATTPAETLAGPPLPHTQRRASKSPSTTKVANQTNPTAFRTLSSHYRLIRNSRAYRSYTVFMDGPASDLQAWKQRARQLSAHTHALYLGHPTVREPPMVRKGSLRRPHRRLRDKHHREAFREGEELSCKGR
jgi:hypothetical protein